MESFKPTPKELMGSGQDRDRAESKEKASDLEVEKLEQEVADLEQSTAALAQLGALLDENERAEKPKSAKELLEPLFS